MDLLFDRPPLLNMPKQLSNEMMHTTVKHTQQPELGSRGKDLRPQGQAF